MSAHNLEIREAREASLESVPDELRPGIVHLWQRSLHAIEGAIQACHELLLPEECERAARYRVERPRGDYILTRATVRWLLSKYLHRSPREITFQYTEYGKPFLANSDLCFNVSHTDGLALMAFTRQREVGVDVERLHRQTDAKKLAERFFSSAERHELRDLTGGDLDKAFFRCWTRKEAYIKAVGEGLSLPLHQFDVSLEANPAEALIATRPDPKQAGRWTIRNVSVAPGYVAAVAVEKSMKAATAG